MLTFDRVAWNVLRAGAGACGCQLAGLRGQGREGRAPGPHFPRKGPRRAGKGQASPRRGMGSGKGEKGAKDRGRALPAFPPISPD